MMALLLVCVAMTNVAVSAMKVGTALNISIKQINFGIKQNNDGINAMKLGKQEAQEHFNAGVVQAKYQEAKAQFMAAKENTRRGKSNLQYIRKSVWDNRYQIAGVSVTQVLIWTGHLDKLVDFVDKEILPVIAENLEQIGMFMKSFFEAEEDGEGVEDAEEAGEKAETAEAETAGAEAEEIVFGGVECIGAIFIDNPELCVAAAALQTLSLELPSSEIEVDVSEPKYEHDLLPKTAQAMSCVVFLVAIVTSCAVTSKARRQTRLRDRDTSRDALLSAQL